MSSGRLPWQVAMLVAAAAYVAIGVGFGVLAGEAGSPTWVKAWRLAAWIFSFVVFFLQWAYERGRLRSSPAVNARHVAAGAALGAFGLAVAGPLRSYAAAGHVPLRVVLALVLWPALTAIPAFAAAWTLAAILPRKRES